jgi:chemotaxis family two-component system response regulator Rcp1
MWPANLFDTAVTASRTKPGHRRQASAPEGHSAPRPALILLDLHLPKLNGREVLAHIKTDDALKTIPTVILTTSEAEADIEIAYQIRADCYLRKPVQSDALDRVVSSINDFWLTRAKLPLTVIG